jgi:hypothetical protein
MLATSSSVAVKKLVEYLFQQPARTPLLGDSAGRARELLD